MEYVLNVSHSTKQQQQHDENSHLFLCTFVYLPLGSKKQNKTEEKQERKKEL